MKKTRVRYGDATDETTVEVMIITMLQRLEQADEEDKGQAMFLMALCKATLNSMVVLRTSCSRLHFEAVHPSNLCGCEAAKVQ